MNWQAELKQTWKSMIQRCHNPSNPDYHRYGGRGVSVCPEWRLSLRAFAEAVGPRPEGTSLDRINNDGNYEPGNVRWATAKEQHRNRADSTHVAFDGRVQSLTDWAREYRIDGATLRSRLARGWDMRRALTEAPDTRFRRASA